LAPPVRLDLREIRLRRAGYSRVGKSAWRGDGGLGEIDAVELFPDFIERPGQEVPAGRAVRLQVAFVRNRLVIVFVVLQIHLAVHNVALWRVQAFRPDHSWNGGAKYISPRAGDGLHAKVRKNPRSNTASRMQSKHLAITMTFQRTVTTPLNLCLSPGVHPSSPPGWSANLTLGLLPACSSCDQNRHTKRWPPPHGNRILDYHFRTSMTPLRDSTAG